MIQSQMLKGVLDGLILHIIKNNETYGYEIIEQLKLNGFYNMTEGTVYPILQRLMQKGLVIGTFKKSTIGPKRKYYFITEKGRDFLQEFYASYDNLERAVGNILQRGQK